MGKGTLWVGILGIHEEEKKRIHPLIKRSHHTVVHLPYTVVHLPYAYPTKALREAVEQLLLHENDFICL